MNGIEFENIPYQRFRQIEKIVENPAFDTKRIKQYSPCLNNYISWILGIFFYFKLKKF